MYFLNSVSESKVNHTKHDNTLRRSIIVPGEANNEYRGGPGGAGSGFGVTGGVFV